MEYINLGLPSGTLWADENEYGFYEFDEAVKIYGDSLPTKKQWEELKNLCQWAWMGNGYKVTGPNGNSMTLPAAGFRGCVGGVYCVDYYGYYCSSTPKDSIDAWYLHFSFGDVYMYNNYRCYGMSVRLVKNTNDNMKNKELNIAEILKDCPKGTKLYSIIHGECTLEGVSNVGNGKYPIVVRPNSETCTYSLTAYGKVFNIEEAECQLFPSKENRDWSTFKAPKKEHEFKPFERVLVRNDVFDKWKAGLFSHCDIAGNEGFDYNANGSYWKRCIPYEGNEHLLGTCDSPDEKGSGE